MAPPHTLTTRDSNAYQPSPSPEYPRIIDSEDTSSARGDWRDTLRNASTLALLGIVTTLATVPVVTAGAAFATASAAVHDWCEQGRMPEAGTTLRRFRRALLPGVPVTAIAAAAVALLVLDVRALISGRVPGGIALLAVTAAIGVALLGTAGLTIVKVGQQGGTGWLPAARSAGRFALTRPAPVLAMGLTLVLGTLLAAFIPATTPILIGFALHAQHAINRRTTPTTFH